MPAACRAFSDSLRLDDALGTLLNLAYCHEREGKLPLAWLEYESARRRASATSQHKRAAFAEQQLAALERKLAFLTIDVGALPPSSTVLVDGIPVDRSRIAGRWPVMPGDCRIEARAPGYVSWGRTFRLAASTAVLKVVVPPLEATTRSAPGEVRSQFTDARRLWGYGAAAVGVVSTATGAYFGLRTFSTKEKADQHCIGNACNARGLALYHDAKRYATIANVTLAAGGALLAASAWLLLVDPHAETDKALVSPSVANDGAGVLFVSSW